MDYLLDTDWTTWLIEVIPGPGLNVFTPSIGEEIDKIRRDLFKMQMALSQDNFKVFDELADSSSFEWVYDERKEGIEAYHGLIEQDCL